MVTEADVQVAEAKCPEPWACPDEQGQPIPAEHMESCPICHGIGLRWPPLSRECPCVTQEICCEGCCSHLSDERFGNWHQEDCDCLGSGRIPDVDLGKVFAIFFNLKLQPRFCQMDDGTIRIDIYDWHGTMMDKYRQYADTPESAACAALLQVE